MLPLGGLGPGQGHEAASVGVVEVQARGVLDQGDLDAAVGGAGDDGGVGLGDRLALRLAAVLLRGLEQVRGRAARGVVLPVVTLGEAGAAFLWRGGVVRVEAPLARVVDTTGAGDGFTAGLLRGLSWRYPSAEALARASRSVPCA